MLTCRLFVSDSPLWTTLSLPFVLPSRLLISSCHGDVMEGGVPVQRIWLMPMTSPFLRKRTTIQQKQDLFMAGRTGWSYLLCDIAISKGLCFYHGMHGTAFFGARLCFSSELRWKSQESFGGGVNGFLHRWEGSQKGKTWFISGNLSYLPPLKSVDCGVPLPYPGLTVFSFGSISVPVVCILSRSRLHDEWCHLCQKMAWH